MLFEVEGSQEDKLKMIITPTSVLTLQRLNTGIFRIPEGIIRSLKDHSIGIRCFNNLSCPNPSSKSSAEPESAWPSLSKYQALSDMFLNRLVYDLVGPRQPISHHVRALHGAAYCQHAMRHISQYQRLSEEFTPKHHDKIDMGLILAYLTLAENRMRILDGKLGCLESLVFKLYRKPI